ncbi:MAG: phosphohistidine phosphatase SixA [Anaerolineae bacterium]
MPKVYLVQHAEAMSEERDPDRPLTTIGRQHAEQVTNLATKLGIEVQQIRHSGKTRAKQTAEILGDALSPAGGVLAVPGLGPVDDVKPVAEILDKSRDPLMLVGHLPFMERLTGQLVTGDADLPVVAFVNAGIVCLERQLERWQVTWIVTPEIAALGEGDSKE